jgi:hypothetical protein
MNITFLAERAAITDCKGMKRRQIVKASAIEGKLCGEFADGL